MFELEIVNCEMKIIDNIVGYQVANLSFRVPHFFVFFFSRINRRV